MSVAPSSALYLSHISENGNSEDGSFHKFFELWLAEQNQHLKDLSEAADESSGVVTSERAQVLVERVEEHYELYYKAKSRWAKQDVLAMLTPSWRSTLEEAFLWIGGWRPSMAFHLLYSKSSLQFEARLNDLMQGMKTCDLGDLCAVQLSELDDMQRRTIREERELTDVMAEHQETVADAPMVELSHVLTEIVGGGNEGGCDNKELEERVESTLEPKVEKLEEILQKADNLRLKTLQGIVGILTPQQAIHFLIAAAELHLRLHEWGKKMDAKKGNHQGLDSTI